jgi:hypothetical protein
MMPMDPRAALVFLLSLCCATALIVAARAETFDGRGAVIIDGDTIALRSTSAGLEVDRPETFRLRCERRQVIVSNKGPS